MPDKTYADWKTRVLSKENPDRYVLESLFNTIEQYL